MHKVQSYHQLQQFIFILILLMLYCKLSFVLLIFWIMIQKQDLMACYCLNLILNLLVMSSLPKKFFYQFNNSYVLIPFLNLLILSQCSNHLFNLILCQFFWNVFNFFNFGQVLNSSILLFSNYLSINFIYPQFSHEVLINLQFFVNFYHLKLLQFELTNTCLDTIIFNIALLQNHFIFF